MPLIVRTLCGDYKSNLRTLATAALEPQGTTVVKYVNGGGTGTLAGNAHQEAFNQVAKADAVMVSEALQRDFDAPMLAAAFPGCRN